ncbi:hypothetical protein OESDEN_20387 [Oesophagostomum dentatum]|uniref:Uncharacterized protein n=1 Tax=Oesophagostomum dentatum TaxID=61180 RepID=A0A0B1S8T3_OESDE|nr:hypothetical protein OESDEN_20387 [Oesophagostomum dentatum]
MPPQKETTTQRKGQNTSPNKGGGAATLFISFPEFPKHIHAGRPSKTSQFEPAANGARDATRRRLSAPSKVEWDSATLVKTISAIQRVVLLTC